MTAAGASGAAAVALVGCGDDDSSSPKQPTAEGTANTSQKPRRGGALMIATNSTDQASLDPHTSATGDSQSIYPAIAYGRLYGLRRVAMVQSFSFGGGRAGERSA